MLQLLNSNGGPLAAHPSAFPQHSLSSIPQPFNLPAAPVRHSSSLPAFRDCTVIDWMLPLEEYERLRKRQLRQPLHEFVASQQRSLQQEQQQQLSAASDGQAPAPHQPPLPPIPPGLQPSRPPFDARKHIDEVFPVGYEEISSVSDMVLVMKRTKNPTPEEIVHKVCRLGTLTVQHCAKYKRLEVQESREARTAIEHMDELLWKAPTKCEIMPDGSKHRSLARPLRISSLGPYPLVQLSNSLVDLILARRPKLFRMAFAMFHHIYQNDVFAQLPEEQRWPYWSLLLFNASNIHDCDCEMAPYLQRLYEQAMGHLSPLMTSPDLAPAHCLSAFIVSAVKNKLKTRSAKSGKIGEDFLDMVEKAAREGRIMGDAKPQHWVDLSWSFMQLGHPSQFFAGRAASAILHAPKERVSGRNVADLLISLMGTQWYNTDALLALGKLLAERSEAGDGNAQVCGDAMWALTALGFYDHEVYDRVISRMAYFKSPDARANARTFFAAARASHVTPALDAYAQVISEQKRLEGWAPHEQANLFQGWAMFRATGKFEDAPGMLHLYRELTGSLLWHKTPRHYRHRDVERIHLGRLLVCSPGYRSPGLATPSKVIDGIRERAEAAAKKKKDRIPTTPEKKKVEDAVANALRASGAEVQQNALVENSVIVGLLMSSSSVKHGVPIEILDQTAYLCHPPHRLTGETVLRHALLWEYCDGLTVLRLSDCIGFVERGDTEGLLALVVDALKETKAASEKRMQVQQEQEERRKQRAHENREMRLKRDEVLNERRIQRREKKQRMYEAKLQELKQKVEEEEREKGVRSQRRSYLVKMSRRARGRNVK